MGFSIILSHSMYDPSVIRDAVMTRPAHFVHSRRSVSCKQHNIKNAHIVGVSVSFLFFLMAQCSNIRDFEPLRYFIARLYIPFVLLWYL